MVVIPALKKLRQEDGSFKNSLGYITRLYLFLVTKVVSY